MQPRPPPRLDTVAALVPPDARAVADVGYDHGQLLLALATRAPAARLIGVERQPGLDARFRARHAAALGPAMARVDLRLGDGLSALSPGEADVLVCAGLGERTLTAWLAGSQGGRASVRDAARRIVLCPADYRGLMRPAANALGWRVADERIAWDAGRYYEVVALEPGAEPDPDPLARLFGPRLFERGDPWLVPWLRDLERRFARARRAFAVDPTRLSDRDEPVDRAMRALPEALARAAAIRDGSTAARNPTADPGSPAS